MTHHKAMRPMLLLQFAAANMLLAVLFCGSSTTTAAAAVAHGNRKLLITPPAAAVACYDDSDCQTAYSYDGGQYVCKDGMCSPASYIFSSTPKLRSLRDNPPTQDGRRLLADYYPASVTCETDQDCKNRYPDATKKYICSPEGICHPQGYETITTLNEDSSTGSHVPYIPPTAPPGTTPAPPTGPSSHIAPPASTPEPPITCNPGQCESETYREEECKFAGRCAGGLSGTCVQDNKPDGFLCGGNKTCKDGVCVEPEGGSMTCFSDMDCPGRMWCSKSSSVSAGWCQNP